MKASDPREMVQAANGAFQLHVLIRRVQERAKALRDMPEPPSGLIYDGSTANPIAARQKAFLDLAAREVLGDEYEWATLVDFAGRVHLQIKGFKRNPATDHMHQLRDEFG